MANENMRAHWTAGAAGWVAHERIFDAVFAPVTAALTTAAELRPGLRVLDVGCGSGTLLAVASARGADPVGVDISPGMVDAARGRVPAATVAVADAQTADLRALAPGAPFDRVVSRFGVMFFADPVAAFANIRAACAPDARLAFVCWRTRDENPMFTLGTQALTAAMDPPPEPARPDEPGPIAFADPDRLHRVLGDAGWRQVSVEPLDVTCDYGTDGTDGVEERLAVVLATTNSRLAREQLLPRLGPTGWARLVDEARAEVRAARVDGVVRFPAATWLVRARNEAR